MPNLELPSFIPLHKRGSRWKSSSSESEFQAEDSHKPCLGRDNLPPWTDKNTTYSVGVVGLHEEIEDFHAWVSPTPTAHQSRLEVVERVRSCVSQLWPAARLEIFGSFKTGLYLPSSDLDLVVFGKWEAIPLLSLERELLNRGIALPETMEVLDRATVPIIKMMDRVSRIKVDISFNMINGIKAAELIKLFKKKYPALPKLVCVLKHFLINRDLSCVFTGGLSSYCLTLMVVSFLQLHRRRDAGAPAANLGVLLLEFLELYGCSFNYSSLAISVTDEGKYLKKNEVHVEPDITHRWVPAAGLTVEDPLQPGNDLARGSFRIGLVRQAFAVAYRQLCRGRRGGGLSKILLVD